MFFYYKNEFEFTDGLTIEKKFTNTELINTDHIVHMTKDNGNNQLIINLINGEILKIYGNYEKIYSDLIKILSKEKGITSC